MNALATLVIATAMQQPALEAVRDLQLLDVHYEGIDLVTKQPAYTATLRFTVPALPDPAAVLIWLYDAGPLTAESLALDGQGAATQFPPGATDVQLIPGMLFGAEPGTSVDVSGWVFLQADRAYWWVAQVSDGFTYGPLSNNAYYGPPSPAPPPPAITAKSDSPESVTLTWPAPGPDIYLYDVRYSASPISEATFKDAAPLASPSTMPTPATGSQQSVSAAIPPGTWYIAAKSTTTTIQSSPISNVATVSVARMPEPPRFEGPGRDGGTKRSGAGGCSTSGIARGLPLFLILPLLALRRPRVLILSGIAIACSAASPANNLSFGTSLAWASYFGGSGPGTSPSGADEINAVRFDTAGFVYVAGYTDSRSFPVVGTFLNTNYNHGYGGGNGDAFVAKIDPRAPSIVWSTYLGGALGQDLAYDLAIDAVGNLYIGGFSDASDFPIVGAPPGGTPHPGEGPRGFVAKLEPTGSQILWSSAVPMGAVNAIAVTKGGTVLVVGSEASVPLVCIEGDGSAFRWSKSLATVWDPTNTITYTSRACGLAVGAQDDVYVAGSTDGRGLSRTPGAFQTAFGGGTQDAFVMKLTPEGTVAWSSLLGGTGWDNIFAIAVDSTGDLVVGGLSDSADFPTTLQSAPGGNAMYLAKLKPSGDALRWSTFVGGGAGNPNLNCLALNGADDVYFAGSIGYSATAFPAVERGFQPEYVDQVDGLVGRITADGATVLWSSYIGGTAGDQVKAIAVGPSGPVVGGFTVSTDFPVTDNGIDRTYGRVGDGFLALVADPVSTMSSAHISFEAVAGGQDPAPQSLRLVAGATSSDWNATPNAAWIEATPTGGSIDPGTSGTITLSISTDGLAVGSYAGLVHLLDTGGSAYDINVGLVVVPAPPPPIVEVAPSSLGNSCSAGAAAGSPWLLLIAAVFVAKRARVC